ncbi:MAG: carotenoid 1,2-hydratase [Methylibium sp.]|nr:carotenoid 1,2-hydratase [Methylibium sp.]
MAAAMRQSHAQPAQAQTAAAPVVRPGVPIRLPRDFGSHPEYRTEWWYVTGALDVPGSVEPFGFQLTFFRSRTDLAPGHPSRFAAHQLLFAHAALTDPQQRRLRHDQRIARAGFGIAEASTTDTAVTLRGWQLDRHGPVGSHHYRARLDAPSQGFAFDLRFDATQPVLLQGDAGYSRKGPEPSQASYYLSEPQLAVSGTLRLDGRALRVAGRAWLDHEWSEALLHPDAVGWDWIGMNLDDGGALTAFRLRRRDGSTLWAGGSFRAPGGTAQSFASNAVRFEPLRTWVSPATRATYPVAWRIETPAGRFEVRARLDAQELDSRGSTGAVYWEGLSDLIDASGKRVGRGYLEMTGYTAALRL